MVKMIVSLIKRISNLRPVFIISICLSVVMFKHIVKAEGNTSRVANSSEENFSIHAAVDSKRLVSANSDANNWITHGRTYSEERFSPLDQINDKNVSQLGLAWYFELNTHRGVEATPIVVDGVMFTTSAWSVVYALDAENGRLLWKWDPQVPKEWGRYVCCDVVNRGVAVWKGKVFVGTLDGRLAALDATNGNLLWEVNTVNKDFAYSITGAPRVINDKVIIGNGGAEFGVRGYVSAYDVKSGKLIWRFYTVPGDPSKGFESPEMEMAARTWTGEWWKYGGGGTAWDSFAYDPDLNLLYIGTGNGSPWSRAIRSPNGGDNLFLSSIVAVNADTGQYAWHYQTTPADNWDYTATQQMILVDMEFKGRLRKVIMQAPKNGFFYVIDRTNGELLSAEKFVDVTWATHVDMASGRPVENTANLYGKEGKAVRPSPDGAHGWHSMSFSQDTSLVYIPIVEEEYFYSENPSYRYKPLELNVNHNPKANRPEPEQDAQGNATKKGRSALIAWDPKASREEWRVQYQNKGSGGVLSTAGNLVIQGVVDGGRLVIYQADNGDKLWEMPVHNRPIAAPVSYMVNGEQYIAINAGWGGAFSLYGGTELDLPKRATGTARLLVFKLGADKKLPPAPDLVQMPEPPPSTASKEMIDKGAGLYHTACHACHGIGAISGGTIRDLRYMSAATHEVFNDIVLKGLFLPLGMASFADQFSIDEVEAIHAFIIERANQDWAAQANGSP